MRTLIVLLTVASVGLGHLNPVSVVTSLAVGGLAWVLHREVQ